MIVSSVTLIAVVGLLSAQGTVRASSVVAPSSAEGEPFSDQATPFPVWLVLGLVVACACSLGTIVAARLYRTTRPAGAAAPDEPSPASERVRLVHDPRGAIPLGFGFLLLMIAQFLGSSSAVALFSIDVEQLDLADIGLLSWGGYAGVLLSALFLGLVLPRAGRVLINGTAPRRWAPDFLVASLWLLLLLPLVMVTSVLSSLIVTSFTDETAQAIGHDTLRALADDGLGSWPWWLVVTSVVIGAPLVEELLYRGCLQSALRSVLGGWGAIGVSSLIFAAMHFSVADLRLLPSLVVLSLGMGLVYERTGRLTTCIVVHALFNASNVALALLIA